MENRKTHYIFPDIIRAFFCIEVLLFHMGLLKGGYLAVCGFFTMSGYLAARSLEGKDVNLLEYYKKRFIKLYLPILVTVFLSLAVMFVAKDIIWISLKPETNSVLLSFNNFWQINANVDYFARHSDSPFMHMWYTSIMLQFELVFPILYMITKKASKELKSALWLMTSILLTLTFVYMFKNMPLSQVYYHTLARIFSLAIGVCAFYIPKNKKKARKKKPSKDVLKKISIILMMLIILALSLFVDSASTYVAASMILVSFITSIMIILSFSIKDEKEDGIIVKLASFISSISYEIFLVSYPVIFFFSYIDMFEKIPVAGYIATVVASILLSIILHQALSYKKGGKKLALVMLVLVLVISSIGVYNYVVTKDLTDDIHALEDELNQNSQAMAEKQKEFEEKAKQDQAKWDALIEDLDNSEKNFPEYVKNLPIVAMGDSVMLGASNSMYKFFPNIYIDADQSRTAWVIPDIVSGLKRKNILPQTIIIHMGTNGNVPTSVTDGIMESLKDCDVFWVLVTNDKTVHVNHVYKELSEKYDNAHLILWDEVSSGHSEYFADGIHLTSDGKKAYNECIFQSLYDFYHGKFEEEKDQIIAEYEKEFNAKVGFFGNDIVSTLYNDLSKIYPKATFVGNKDIDLDKLKEEIKTKVEEKTVGYRVVLAFDPSFEYDTDFINEVSTIIGEKRVLFIVNTNKDKSSSIKALESDRIHIIDASDMFERGSSYLSIDRKHLSEKGSKELTTRLEKELEFFKK